MRGGLVAVDMAHKEEEEGAEGAAPPRLVWFMCHRTAVWRLGTIQRGEKTAEGQDASSSVKDVLTGYAQDSAITTTRSLDTEFSMSEPMVAYLHARDAFTVGPSPCCATDTDAVHVTRFMQDNQEPWFVKRPPAPGMRAYMNTPVCRRKGIVPPVGSVARLWVRRRRWSDGGEYVSCGGWVYGVLRASKEPKEFALQLGAPYFCTQLLHQLFPTALRGSLLRLDPSVLPYLERVDVGDPHLTSRHRLVAQPLHVGSIVTHREGFVTTVLHVQREQVAVRMVGDGVRATPTAYVWPTVYKCDDVAEASSLSGAGAGSAGVSE